MVFSFDDKRWPDLTVRYRTLLAALARLAFALTFVATASSAGSVQLPSEAAQAIDKMYGGDPDGGIALLHTYEATRPSDPLPYTIEARGTLVEDLLRRRRDQIGHGRFAKARKEAGR